MAEPLALPVSLRAPAKLNLGLRVGPKRGAEEGGLHAVRSLMCPLELSDRLVVSEAAEDEVRCEAVAGPNLVEEALTALRGAGWDAPPLCIEIEKRIPVAAGLGGGSADAAAVLRLAAGAVGDLDEIAFRLGSDVPSQLRPSPCIVGGHGERIEAVRLTGGAGVVLVPAEDGLGAGGVYAKADKLGLAAQDEDALDAWEAELRRALEAGTPAIELGSLLGNTLEAAARALAPDIGGALEALAGAGARPAFVCGSGPTVAGLFDDLPAADAAAAGLGARYSKALVTALDTTGRVGA
jgi:4-diphosphocytidyl-2-C-methyl-D-erythritol kinase